MFLVAGLGNPGEEYALTPHNMGFLTVDRLAERHGIRVTRKDSRALVGLGEIDGQPVMLAKPQTYMNLSGQAIQAVASYYKIAPAEMLIAHDELDLSPGIIRLKHDGGHGGHNGLRDTIKHLSTRAFYRLRIGIGHPGVGKDVSDYVLSPPNKADRSAIDSALHDAEGILPLVMAGEYQKAMQLLHTE